MNCFADATDADRPVLNLFDIIRVATALKCRFLEYAPVSGRGVIVEL